MTYLTQNQGVRLAIKFVRVMIKTALTTFTRLSTNLTSINPFPHNDTFRCPWKTSLLKTLWAFENSVGKGEIALNEQFLLFPQCFLPVWITFSIFVKFEIVVFKLFQFGRA